MNYHATSSAYTTTTRLRHLVPTDSEETFSNRSISPLRWII